MSLNRLRQAGQLERVPLMMTEGQEDKPCHTSILQIIICVMLADILLPIPKQITLTSLISVGKGNLSHPE